MTGYRLAGLVLIGSTVVFIVSLFLNIGDTIDPEIGFWLSAFSAAGILISSPITLALYFAYLDRRLE